MKRFVSILLAVLMLVSLCTVTSAARGYVLTVPESLSAHNLEAYGLHTLNVYSTDKAPTVDGVIDTAEYPGPNNGMCLESVPGDNMWMNRYYLYSTTTTQNELESNCNWTPYVAREDMPDYIKTYLTYDDSYLYFAVATQIPAIRATTDNVTGATRNATWSLEVRTNFMQSDNVVLSHGGTAGSYASNRYYLYKGFDLGEDGKPLAQTATSVKLPRRTFTLYENSAFVTDSYDSYVDDLGQTWNTTLYKRADNFMYKVTVLEDNKWGVIFEGRMPLGDVLRITDVEYEDGSPLDYVPEWGAWGSTIRLQAYVAKSGMFPNGTEYEIRPEDVIYAQTFLPAGGAGNSGANGIVAGYQLHNTLGAAIKAVHGKGSKTPSFLMNPVHFLGEYDETFAYGEFYSSPTESVLKETSRVTRTRGVLTSAERGKHNRVVGVATQAAVATGDDLTLTLVLSATMLLCATTAALVVVMKKRSSRTY